MIGAYHVSQLYAGSVEIKFVCRLTFHVHSIKKRFKNIVKIGIDFVIVVSWC